MKYRGVLPAIAVISFCLLLPPKAHAIIFLPAVILIPIAKIVAVIFGIASVPALTVSSMIARFKKLSFAKAAALVLAVIVAVILLIALTLKITNPDRPWL